MKHLNIAMIAAILSLTCAGFSLAQTTHPDGRPSATLRMEAKGQGVVLEHGDGPGQCDYFGAREALIFEEKGVYHLFHDGAGPKGWLACLATCKDLKTWFLFTNHIGLDGGEYTDAVWVYWSKDLNKWDAKNKAVVLDGKNCTDTNASLIRR